MKIEYETAIAKCNNCENKKRKRFILFALCYVCIPLDDIWAMSVSSAFGRRLLNIPAECLLLLFGFPLFFSIVFLLLFYTVFLVLSFFFSFPLCEVQTQNNTLSTFIHIHQFCIVVTKSTWAADDEINWLHFLWFCLFEFVYHSILSDSLTYTPMHTPLASRRSSIDSMLGMIMLHYSLVSKKLHRKSIFPMRKLGEYFN